MSDELIDEAAKVDSDKYDELLSSTIEKEKEESDNSKEIERRAQINDFVIEWAKTPDAHYTEVGDKLKMHPQKASDYANEFINIMKDASKNNYPQDVFDYFNHHSIPQIRRITAGILDTLAPTVEAYIRKIEKPNNSNDSNDSILMTSDNPTQPQPTVPIPPNPPGMGFNKIPQVLDPDDLGDEGLVQSNHTITQIINFGLKKFNIEPAQQRRYIMDLIRTNKLFYATNRNALRDLLSSVIKHAPTVNAFLDWLESVAPLYLSPGEPFYRMMNGGMGVVDPNNPMPGGMNPMIQQLMQNLPPAQAQMVMQNLFANNKTNLQQQQAEEDAQMDRQVSRLYKVMTIKMLSQAMDPAATKTNPMMDMQQNYMMQGWRPSEVIQPDGTKRIEWLPPYAQQGGGQGSPFQDVQSIIGLVSSIISLTGAANKGTDLNETLTKVFMEKMMADPVDQMLKLKQATEQLGLTRSGPSIDPVKQLELQMNMAKLENEKTFGLKQLEIQEKQMAREEAREMAHEQQSNQNIEMLMKFVPGVINNMAMPVIQKFFGGGGNQPQQAPPQPSMMGEPQQDYSGTMFNPPQQNYGKANRLVKTGQGTPVGGILNDNEYYVDPQNGPTMSGIQEQGELQKQAELRQQIENEVMHKINMTHLRNNMAPPSVQEQPVTEQFSREQLMTLSNEELAQVGQIINNQREKYEASIQDYNTVVMMRQQQAQQQQEEVITETQQQQHPPVVSEEEYKTRFNVPEGTDMNDDGVISEEDYEQTSSSVQDDGSQVVDFESVDQQSPPPQQDESLLSEDEL